MFSDKLFLASQSPRRRELSQNLFNKIVILDIEGEEPEWNRREAPRDYVLRCVEHKWRGAQNSHKTHRPQDRGLLLVADTVVIMGNKVYGKPKDKKDALRILRELSGKAHEVVSGFCMGWVGPGGQASTGVRMVTTRVAFRKLSNKEISEYVRTGESMDKAGAYGFQGKALPHIDWIEGPYTNVLGLPLLELEAAAQELGAPVLSEES